jgi:tetratricopeptide (TPR) repeat protein
MKVKNLFAALAIGFCVLGANIDASYAAKPKTVVAEVIEKTLSGRTNPKTPMGNKMSKALNKAQKLAEEDKFADANAVIAEALNGKKLTPYEISKANQIMASNYWQQEQYDDAYKATQAAIQANGLTNIEHLQTMFMAVQILTANEKYKESVVAFDAYVKEAPKIKASEYANQGINYYYQDDYKNAVIYIDKAIATGEPSQNQWTQIKANSLYQGESYDAAIVYLKELLVKDPANKQWLGLMVSSYLSLDKYTEAQNVLVDAKNKGMLDNEGMWTQLYQLYGNNDQFVQAADTIDEGIKGNFLKPNAKIKSSQGQYLYMAAQDIEGKPEAKPLLERAIAAFKVAMADDPKDGTAELWMGQIALFDQDNPKAARDYLASAVTKTLKQPGNAYYYLGVSEDQSGNKAAARAALIKAAGYPESKSNAERYLKNLK